MKLNEKHINYVILLLLLIFTFFKTYSLHTNYRFPYHHDEWQHLALSIQAIEEGYNKQYNPYLDIPNSHADLEPGFHLFLSSFFLITDLDPILNYQYFAAIFAVLSGFTIFLCCYRLSKKYFIGILSLIVFISLPTNVNVLGNDFFVPLTMAIPFIFLYILFFVESLKENATKKFVFSLIILVLLFFVHPPSFVILLFPLIIEVLFNLKNVKRIYSTLPKYSFFIVIILFMINSTLLIWKGSFFGTKEYILDLFYFEPGWGKLEVTYFLPLLYGIINTLFALLGFIVGYKSRFRFFIILAFISLSITAFFNVFGFTFFIPYPRAVHYTMLALVPLTAVGFYMFLEYLTKFLNLKQKLKLNSIFGITMTLIFLIVILNSNYDLNLKYKDYDNLVITESDYSTLIWIKGNIDERNVFVTPYFMTSAVWPIARNKVISIIPAQMEGGPTGDNLNFYVYDCDKQRELINRTRAQYVLSKQMLNCSYLEGIYFESDYIYKII